LILFYPSIGSTSLVGVVVLIDSCFDEFAEMIGLNSETAIN